MTRHVCAALALAASACLPPNSTPPRAPVTRVVVRLDVSVEGVPAPERCREVCPAASAAEALAYCHAAEVPADVVAHRQALGEQVSGGSALVCAYGPASTEAR